MGPLNLEQVCTWLFAAAAVLSASSMVEAEAAPVFPPAHLSATAFANEATQASTLATPQPWYFSARGARSEVTAIERDWLRNSVSATIEITPWYRAAN